MKCILVMYMTKITNYEEIKNTAGGSQNCVYWTTQHVSHLKHNMTVNDVYINTDRLQRKIMAFYYDSLRPYFK